MTILGVQHMPTVIKLTYRHTYVWTVYSTMQLGYKWWLKTASSYDSDAPYGVRITTGLHETYIHTHITFIPSIPGIQSHSLWALTIFIYILQEVITRFKKLFQCPYHAHCISFVSFSLPDAMSLSYLQPYKSIHQYVVLSLFHYSIMHTALGIQHKRFDDTVCQNTSQS